jgi:hypothetical protein
MDTSFGKLIKIYICYLGQLIIRQNLDDSNFGFLIFDSSKQVFEALDGLKSKIHEYPKFITHKDLQTLFRLLFHLRKC